MTTAVRATIWNIFKDSPASTGNWYRFDLPWDVVVAAAARWRANVAGHPQLWLCWNVNDAWCLVQQELILEQGWTPVVGWDPLCGVGRPPLADGAIAIDFTADLGLPGLFMHVPLELAFLWIEHKLAFWHSDLLLPRPLLRTLAARFTALQPDEMAAVYSYGGLRNLLRTRVHRYWELCGCTTQAVSQDQYDKGCGWWTNIAYHPNAPGSSAEQAERKALHIEHGVGIRYWQQKYGGRVQKIRESSLAPYHFSVTSVPEYQIAENKALEMEINFDLRSLCIRLGIEDLLRNCEI